MLDTLTTSGGLTNPGAALGTGTSILNAGATTNVYTSQTLAELNIADGVTVTLGGLLPFPASSEGLTNAAAAVPEPGTVGLLLASALGLLRRRRN